MIIWIIPYWKEHSPLKRLLDSLSWFIIGLLYVFVMSGLMSNILYGEGGISYYTVLFISIVFYGLANIVFLNRNTVKVFAAITIIIAVIAAIYCLNNETIMKSLYKHAGQMYIVWDKILTRYELEAETYLYLRISLIVTANIASILVINLFKKIKSFFILNGIILVFFIFSNSITKSENKVLFIIFCVLIIISFINKVSAKKAKDGLLPDELSLGSMLICTIPIILIPVFFIARTPKSELPIQNNMIGTINSLMSEFENRFKYTEFETFSLSSIGFTNKDTNRLGGDITANNIEVLRVKTKLRTYLRGATYNSYDNSTWTTSYSLNDANEYDLNETLDAWSYIPVEELFINESNDDLEFLENLKNGDLESLLFPTYSMEITIRNLKTNLLFIPLKCNMPLRYAGNKVIPTYEVNSCIATTDPILKRGDRYKLTFIQPLYGDDLFKKALRYSRDDLYNEVIKELNNEKSYLSYQYLSLPESYYISVEPGIILPSINEDSLSPEQKEIQEKLKLLDEKIGVLSQLEYKSNEIYNHFTKIPEDMPDRVIELSHEISDDYDTDYDKVVAIEQYLRGNHTYTYSPGEVPVDRDLVDYFLFDKKEGYCSYYATSMVILLRSIGIPARYVEGYVLPSEQIFEDVYAITNQNAHAWVEVYFEGFGWMAFEPTSAYAGTMNYRSAFSDLSYQENLSYQEMMERYKSSQFSNNTYTPTNPLPTNENKSKDVKKILGFILLGIIALVIALIIIDLFIIIIMSIKFKIIKKEKALLIRYYHMIKWLSIKGYKIEIGTTAREFADKIDETFYLPYTFGEVTEVFSKVRYGHQSITDSEVDMVNKTYKALRTQILKEMGIKRYLPLRRLILSI